VDFSGVVRGYREFLPERDLFWHFPHYWGGDRVRPWSAIRSGDWKLIRFYEDSRHELYNITVDESETNDLAALRPDVVGPIGIKLDAWLKETGAKLPRQR
jgi:arylsulfatase A-like enzyme